MGGGEHAGGNLQLGVRNIAHGKDVEEVCQCYTQLCVLPNIPDDQEVMKSENFKEVKKKEKRNGGRQRKETWDQGRNMDEISNRTKEGDQEWNLEKDTHLHSLSLSLFLRD